MAITSYGYANTVTPNNVWAIMQWGLGNRYWVYDNTDCAVTAKSDGTRQVNVATGYMGGWGVVDRITATEVVTLPTVSTGTQYFMIVARRTWQTTQATTITYIDAGTTAPTTLPTRNTGATSSSTGVDDQPLAIVSVTAGKTVPAVFADLRVLGTSDRGIMLANHALALAYMTFSGQVIRIGGTTYSRVPGSSGSYAWETDPTVTQSGPGLGNPLSISGATGWATVNELTCTGTKSGNTVGLHVVARRSGSDLVFSGTSGSLNDTAGLVMTVGNALWRPPRILPFTCTYIGGGSASYSAGGQLETDGQIRITDGKPATAVIQRTTVGQVSFRAHIVWNRES